MGSRQRGLRWPDAPHHTFHEATTLGDRYEDKPCQTLPPIYFFRGPHLKLILLQGAACMLATLA